MSPTDLIGIVASIISTVSFVPQAYRVFRTRSTAGISVISFGIIFLGGCFWSLYGWLIGSYQVLLTNAFISSVVFFIIVTILTFKGENT